MSNYWYYKSKNKLEKDWEKFGKMRIPKVFEDVSAFSNYRC